MSYASNVRRLQPTHRPVKPTEGAGRQITAPAGATLPGDMEICACVANEFVTTATWVAAAAGIINRCFLDRLPTSSKYLQECLPPDPVLHLGLKSAAARPVEAVLVFRAEQLCLFLRGARHALEEALLGQERPAREQRQLQLRACDLWQAAAETTLLGLHAIEDVIGYGRLGLDDENMGDLCDALVAARSGHSPFQKDGVVLLPAWAERRLMKRTTLNMTAELTEAGRTREVLVTNASPGGLGLEYAEGLKEGELVSIKLQNGRHFIGQVRWSAGSRAGVTFRKSLRPNDPLLSG